MPRLSAPTLRRSFFLGSSYLVALLLGRLLAMVEATPAQAQGTSSLTIKEAPQNLSPNQDI